MLLSNMWVVVVILIIILLLFLFNRKKKEPPVVLPPEWEKRMPVIKDGPIRREPIILERTKQVPIIKTFYFTALEEPSFNQDSFDYQYSQIIKMYDVQINDVEQIDESAYNKLREMKAGEARPLLYKELKSEIVKGEDSFEVETKHIMFHSANKPKNVQVDGKEVFGEIDGNISFYLNRTEYKTVKYTVVIGADGIEKNEVELDEESTSIINDDKKVSAIKEQIVKEVTDERRQEFTNRNIKVKTQREHKIDENNWKSWFVIILLLLLLLGIFPGLIIPVLIILGYILLTMLLNWVALNGGVFISILRWGMMLGLILLILSGFSYIISSLNHVDAEDKRRTKTSTYNFDDDEDSETHTKDSVDYAPVVENNEVVENRPPVSTDFFHTHHRVWVCDGVTYGADLKVRNSDLISVNNYRNGNVLNSFDIEREYADMATFDSKNLKYIYQELDSINSKQGFSDFEFAELIVTMVQDVRYAYVLGEDCETYFGTIDNDAAKDDCKGNVRMGVQSPVQFMADLKGDCDTRTVFLYSILKHYGYDVAILNSDIYLHSMLGLNLKSRITGDYIEHYGKRYYFWETTGKNFPIGMLPSETSNTNYWYVALN
jgi:hypothetical protein